MWSKASGARFVGGLLARALRVVDGCAPLVRLNHAQSGWLGKQAGGVRWDRCGAACLRLTGGWKVEAATAQSGRVGRV